MAHRLTTPALAALGLLAALGARPAPAETRPPLGGKVVASLASAPIALDPVAALSYAEVSLVDLVFDTLYRVDGHGRVVPHLAEAPPAIAADGLEVRVRVRRGVVFHDGKPLGAADIVASLRRAASAPATEWALAPVKKIAQDGDVVVFTLRRTTEDLALLLSIPQLAITPGGKAPGRTPVGSGPFALKKLADGSRGRVELEAAPDHFAGRPYLDRLVLRWFDRPDDEARAYEAGDADASLRGAVAFAGHTPKHATVAVDGGATILVYLGFGRAHPGLDADPDFRRAVSLAIGRGAFRHVGAGERVVPALAPESPDLGGPAPTAAELGARPDEARKALARASARHDTRVKLEILVDVTRPEDAEAAARVVAALDDLGLSAAYVTLDPKEYARRVAAGACDLYVGQLVAPTTDGRHEIAAAFAAGGDRWPVARLADGTFTREAALAAFAERLPVVPLYHRSVRAHHRKALHGVAFDALGRLGWADVFVFPTPDDAGPR